MLLPTNTLIIDRGRFSSYVNNQDVVNNYRSISVLDFFAIRETDGSFTLVKNRYDGKNKVSCEQELYEIIRLHKELMEVKADVV